tara:strand:- start:610 stop:885 length:276 start_codon:yes stop_codon:yes gene_type:complete
MTTNYDTTAVERLTSHDINVAMKAMADDMEPLCDFLNLAETLKQSDTERPIKLDDKVVNAVVDLVNERYDELTKVFAALQGAHLELSANES